MKKRPGRDDDPRLHPQQPAPAKAGGTTTLFAALNVLDGSVIGQCMARHRHQEFLRFLNRIETASASRASSFSRSSTITPSTSIPRCALGSPGIQAGRFTSPLLVLLGQRRRELFCHSHPPAIATRRLPFARRPASSDQPVPRRAQPQTRPFVWTADPDRIIEKVNRGYQAIASHH